MNTSPSTNNTAELQGDMGDRPALPSLSDEEELQAHMDSTLVTFWRENKIFRLREHLSMLARPDHPPTTCKAMKKKKRIATSHPHYSAFIELFGDPWLGFFGSSNWTPRRRTGPAPNCRCDYCTGYRFHSFVEDVRGFAYQKARPRVSRSARRRGR